jgi:hypothetical protein
MHWSDQVERLGRTILWLTLASVFVLVPLTVINMQSEAERLKDAASKAEEKLAEALKTKDDGPARLTLESMGPIMRGLLVSSAEGRVWFTNVSNRTGVVCISGTATNPDTNETAESLPACQQVGAYTSVALKVDFAGPELAQVCKGVTCRFAPKDVPDRK